MEAWSWVAAMHGTSALDDPERPVLIVEDDAIFREDCDCPMRTSETHKAQCARPLTWDCLARKWYVKDYAFADFLYLGGQWLVQKQPYDEGRSVRKSPVTRVHNGSVCRSHAYLVTPAAAQYLLDYDWCTHMPWTLQPWVDEMRVGLVYPPIAGQAENRSAISGRIHKERWWE